MNDWQKISKNLVREDLSPEVEPNLSPMAQKFKK